MMYVVGSVDQILFTVIPREEAVAWEWGDMTTIATLESRKIRKVEEEAIGPTVPMPKLQSVRIVGSYRRHLKDVKVSYASATRSA